MILGSDAQTSSGSELYRGLLVGMHAMAQPLTLLQSRLYLALAQARGVGAEDALLAGAAEDLESLCALFRLLQQLIHMDSVPAHVGSTPLAAVVRALTEDAEAVFAGAEISFAFNLKPQEEELEERGVSPSAGSSSNASREIAVLIDLVRTRLALSQMLAVARECGPAVSRLTGGVRLSDRWAEFVIEARPDFSDPASPHCEVEPGEQGPSASGPEGRKGEASPPLTEKGCLLLALARVALASQGAELGFCLSPLHLRALLPIVPPCA